ncbi:MAG: tetratricopeptide repeat protein [Candidatus Hydrogenedentes bacterium]|nr:tetratricopeptide repeat protein [Candidatus Hydrogenedentota bacterium]
MSVLLSMLMAASILDVSFDAATKAYNEDNYAEAVTVLEQLVAYGVVEPEVFYNLGNAYYRSGRLAHAIANYERALQLNPRLEGAQENLDASIRQTERGLSRPQPPDWEQSLLFWHDNIRRETSLRLAVLAWCLLWALLAIRQVRRFPYLRRSALALGLLAAIFSTSWWVKSSPQQLAVAAHRGVPVRYGVSDTETVRFELYEGDRVVIDRRHKGWARVETAGGERGWTRDEYLVFVGPPYERPSYQGTEAGPQNASTDPRLEGVLPQKDAS